jgi:hypothetical protein
MLRHNLNIDRNFDQFTAPRTSRGASVPLTAHTILACLSAVNLHPHFPSASQLQVTEDAQKFEETIHDVEVNVEARGNEPSGCPRSAYSVRVIERSYTRYMLNTIEPTTPRVRSSMNI